MTSTTTTATPSFGSPQPYAAPDGRGLQARRRPFGATRLRERTWLTGLLSATALLYGWGLNANGYANDFYAAAVQAGTKSWKAFFFGSFDSSNFITVDKPPLSLWPMEISTRLFGFNSWAVLLPQAIEGVCTVWLLYATVRRWFGARTAWAAGALMALTPVAVLMFRFNNPDAMMTLLIVAAAYCVTRATEVASTRWLVLAGLVMGLSFLAKGLQPFTVLPALGFAYAVAAPSGLRRRLAQLLAGAAAVIAGAGWWVLAVTLTPAADRPYIGGSGNNTALGLAFGYNGLSRITGGSGGGPDGRGGANFSGSPGIGRLFNSLNGGQIAWLIPTALVAMAALAVMTFRLPRTDRTRAALILWGGWLLVTGAVLSFASGIIHTYYTVELAPAIAALVAIGGAALWKQRADVGVRWALAGGVLVTGAWSYALLRRSPTWHPWIADLVLAAAVIAAIAVAAGTAVRRATVVAALAGSVAVAGGSSAYALDTAATAYRGAVPSAGPAVGTSGPGGGAAFGRRGGTGPTGDSANSALVALVKGATTRWAAATIGSQTAGPLELASGVAVMSIGGFNGSDAAPTLSQFEAYVAAGEIHYFISGFGGSPVGGGPVGGGPGGAGPGGAGPGGAGPGGRGTGSEISTWVAAHFRATTVGGVTVYDLTDPVTAS